MIIVPITYRKACEYISKHHRHHKKPQGQKFAVGCEHQGKLVGVACAGRPVSRMLDSGFTIEITRVCTNGTKNACSMLYGAICRVAKEMGYKKAITYILESEHGSSLKASNFYCDLQVAGGGSWSTPSRLRIDKAPTVNKQRWVRVLS